MSKDDNDDFATGAVKGLTSFLEKLARLAEESGNLEKSSEFETKKGFKGMWGLTVKTNLGDKEGGDGSAPNFVVEPFGTHVEENERGQVTIDPIREPPVDVFDEEDHILIVAEMPGIQADDVTIDVEGDVLSLRAERGELRFRKELLLPRTVDADAITVRATNGIVEIRCNG